MKEYQFTLADADDALAHISPDLPRDECLRRDEVKKGCGMNDCEGFFEGCFCELA